MTVSSAQHLKGYYDATRALGDKVVVSDATLEIEGFETMSLLTPQFPMPELSVQLHGNRSKPRCNSRVLSR